MTSETKLIGPRTTDQKFFCELVDTSLPGVEGLAEAAAASDWETCRKIFANRIRTYLDPERYAPIGSVQRYPLFRHEEDPIAAAEDVLKNRLTSTGITYDFGDNIDWEFNGTEDGYVEWTWQLNRHRHWMILAKAYQQTGDEKYAKCFARQFKSWVQQAVVPADDPPTYCNESKCWRSIETGQRMGNSFPIALHAFYRSPAFTDELLVDFYKSIWEHGDRLIKWHARFNWLFMEMDGMGQMSVLYPELKDSSSWYDFTVKTLREELTSQVYLDGFQGELSTGYQNACVAHPMKALVTAEAYDRPMPKDIYDKIENMLELFVKVTQPNLKTPSIGDGHSSLLKDLIAPHIKDFRHNPVLLWAATEGKEGTPPPYNTVVLPYSGYTVMRTGWTPQDTYAYFDGGPFGLCHQHQDKLNLVIWANGHYLLPENGTYAYDTSPMRRYAISTRSHNTGRVNGMDQNRQRHVIIPPSAMTEDSGMKTILSDAFDYAWAVYEDGYSNDYTETAFQPSVTIHGDLLDKEGRILSPETPPLYTGAKHARGVMLVKKTPADAKPFFLVFDRFMSEDDNEYELLWHMDAEYVNCADQVLTTQDFTMLQSAQPAKTLANSILRGETSPEWQGWQAAGMEQGNYTPIWTAKTTIRGKSLRQVTLLYTDSYDNCPIAKIEAGNDIAERSVKLIFKNGESVVIDEPDI